MANLIEKFISLELGMLAMTRDKVQETVDEFIKRGEVSRDEGMKMVDELIHRGEKSRESVKGEVEKIMNDVLSRMDVPKRDEMTALRRDIEILQLELAQLRRSLEKEQLENTFGREKKDR
jgi:polyhydroxyalkanoate synthesis regulator phasin